MIYNFKLFENQNNKKYYRAESTFLGDEFTFEVEKGDYYEKIGNNNEPLMYYGEWKISDTKEICASKIIGGAVLGAFSMRHEDEYYIYEISEKPDKDISHWLSGDFHFIEEVRYRKDIHAKFIGKIKLNQYQIDLFTALYETFAASFMESEEEWERINDEWGELLDDIDEKVYNEIKKINNSLVMNESKHEMNIDVENKNEELTKKIVDNFSFIIYKQDKKPKNIRVNNLSGYFNNKDFKNSNLIYKTNIEIELSNGDVIEGKLSTYKEKSENNITIKINDKIIYNLDNPNFNNEILIDKMKDKYEAHIKKNWKIK